MGVTYITMIYNFIIRPDHNNYVVRFGILHFLSICMMLAPLLIKTKARYLIPLAAIIIVLGNYCRTDSFASLIDTFPWFDNNYTTFDLPALTGYEIKPWFRSADYFPLLPYSGYFIIGVVAGRFLYKDKKSLFKSSTIEKLYYKIFLILRKTHSAIYLVHQPILFLLWNY